MSYHVFEGLFFLILNHPICKGANGSHFFTCFEGFKGLWVCLLILYTLIFGPHKKRRALTESEVSGTLSVRSPAYWPYPSSVLTRHNSRTRDWNRGLGFGGFRDWLPFSLPRTCPHCATAIPRSVSLTFSEGAEFMFFPARHCCTWILL